MNNIFFKKCAWCICAIIILAQGLLAQQKTITGVIKDHNGSVMPGVTVVVKGTTEGTFSSADGKYTIRVPNDKSILVFSMKGLATQEIIAGDQREINVTMREIYSQSRTHQEKGKVRGGLNLGWGEVYPRVMYDGLYNGTKNKWMFAGDINLGYNLKENMNVSIRLGAQQIYRWYWYRWNYHLAGYYTYYFDTKTIPVTPFIGGGLGFHRIFIDYKILGSSWNDRYTVSKIGGMLNVGFEWWKFRVAAEYNLIPGKMDIYSYSGSPGNVKQNYMMVTAGFFFGGGNPKKTARIAESRRLETAERERLAQSKSPTSPVQQKTVTGVITDRKGNTMRGVTVVVKGTTEGTFSSVDGNYTIRIPNNSSVLVFSMKGFATQEITVGDQREIDVTMTKGKGSKYPPCYVALTGGASTFGTYSIGEIKSGGPAVLGADVAYFFGKNIGVGVKLNLGRCNVDVVSSSPYITGNLYRFTDEVLFIGPALYGRWGKGKLAFTTVAGVGGLSWRARGEIIDQMYTDRITYTSVGGFVSAGVNYMLWRHFGIGLNVQSVLGTLKNHNGDVRNPAGIGVTFGVNFRF